jgi:hypothetical protein
VVTTKPKSTDFICETGCIIEVTVVTAIISEGKQREEMCVYLHLCGLLKSFSVKDTERRNKFYTSCEVLVSHLTLHNYNMSNKDKSAKKCEVHKCEFEMH